jgi:hypothetical protein
VNLAKGASWFAGGHVVENCDFSQSSYAKCVDLATPNCVFKANHFGSVGTDAYMVIGSTASSTWMIGNTYTTGATLTDASSNSVGWGRIPDYVSSITSFANSTDDDMVLAATFTHNLNSKNLDYILQCSNTSDFSGNVWPIHHQGIFNSLDDTVQIIFNGLNTCRVILKSHARREGVAYSATKTYVQQIVDPDNYADLYTTALADFSGAGGHTYSTIYLRLALWKL